MPDAATGVVIEKFSVKLYARDPSGVVLHDFILPFHKWIQFKRIEGLLIDVTDYSHVKNGPGILLTGHDADYYMDESEGPLGLLYCRKRRSEGANADRIVAAFASALKACQTLEKDPALKKKGLAFDGSRLRFILNDRLVTPNTDETAGAIKPDLIAALERLYPGQTPEITRVSGDSRRRLALDVTASETAGISGLLDRLK